MVMLFLMQPRRSLAEEDTLHLQVTWPSDEVKLEGTARLLQDRVRIHNDFDQLEK